VATAYGIHFLFCDGLVEALTSKQIHLKNLAYDP
jgi:hypothetical protein